MKISIVTLSFNQHAFLREALESVLQQGYPDLEYIVVDPGSTDGSRELIQSYAAGITHMLFEPDRGTSDGLQKGFAMATGDIFGFINSDDLLEPGSLKRVADFFQAHPECDIVMGNGYVIDVEGRPVRHVRSRDFTVNRYFYGGTQFLQQSTFFRREVYLKSPGFNAQNKTCWDGELFISMVHQGARLEYLDADLGRFRVHSHSITGSQRLKKAYVEDRRRMFREVLGRDWRTTDDFWKLLYKSELALRRIGIVR